MKEQLFRFVEQMEIGTNRFVTVEWGPTQREDGETVIRFYLPNDGQIAGESEPIDPAIVSATRADCDDHVRRQFEYHVRVAIENLLASKKRLVS